MEISTALSQYIRVELKDESFHSLSENEKKALSLIVKAARLLDQIYLRQVWGGNPGLKAKLEADQSEKGKELLRFFNINYGPWDRLNHDQPFLEEVPEKPKGSNFYPGDMEKEEFEKWVASLSESDQEKARGFYQVIRRSSEKALILVPYSQEYQEFLLPASNYLKEAADLVENASLATFLRSRAEAFLSNEYRESEENWLKVGEDSKLEITIGPYEVYEDSLFNYKASFEAFVTIRDFESTEQLKNFRNWMQELEDNLPIPSEMKQKEIKTPPIVVVNEIFVGGDHAGPQTAAFNLPNDEKVLEKGSKMVILKNVQEAKFDKILKKIAKIVIHEEQQPLLSFHCFFTHILLHEMSHSLGPHSLPILHSTVRKELQELHSALEEAKADIAGLFAVKYLSDLSRLDPSLRKSFYVTYLASAFRSIRFGLEEAHGKGQAVQLNFLLDEGAVEYDEKRETFGVNFDKIEEAVRKLTAEILLIQGNGDKEKARGLLERLGVNREVTKKSLEKLKGIPIDIEPRYLLFEE